MVTAMPIQLMSDHIFLGASVVAILSAELVLLRVNLRSQRKPLPAQLLGVSGMSPVFLHEIPPRGLRWRVYSILALYLLLAVPI